ncbi:MAG: GMC family oxidoreductase [Verrucomicrobiales bacterium VVV1]|nr:MAG: GMC family oxidoreductase [Verrucomicrobiales bacterium VVV1]
MPFLNTSRTRAEQYDAIVVGSGAAGGMAAWALARKGAKVLMLESGRNYEPTKETPMFQSFADAPLRGASTPEKPGGFFHANIGGWAMPDEPYVVRSKSKGHFHEAAPDNRMTTDQNFMWWRGRMLGGRTNHWGRVSLRMGPLDFKPRSTDGLGFDWPISYEDIAPWYDKVDQLVGIFGSKEGLENNPDSDYFLPAPKPRAYELLLQRAGKKLGIPVIPSRMAILTKPLNGRAACFYASSCSRGCSIGANFQSTTVLIPPALATGNLDVLTDAHVREVSVDGSGKATGVHFIDKKTGREEHVSAKLVILGASSCETGRILLNSKSKHFPTGLGNSTGHLGRWLTDSTGSGLGGRIPALENIPLHNEDGVSTMHTYAPWTPDRQKAATKLGVPRGYYMAWSGGRQMPDLGSAGEISGLVGNSYGSKYKQEARRYFGSFIDLHARGEMIPNEKSFMEIDPQKKDRWGVPVARFNFEWSEHEIKQAAHMQKTFAEMIEGAGGIVSKAPETDGRKAMTAGGSVNHEMGVARMSATAKDGVTNQWGQLWDCPNVMVADGAVFCSNPFKNPTISILALAWRGSEHLFDEVKKGNL